MFRKTLIAAIAAALALVLAASRAEAWGAAHVGYTHVGPGGVQHYGRTAVSGPYGSYSGGHASSYEAGGAYRTGGGYATGTTGAAGYHYSGTSSYGAHYGTGYGTVGTYGGGGVYRDGVYYRP
jgi:hypothetical protein